MTLRQQPKIHKFAGGGLARYAAGGLTAGDAAAASMPAAIDPNLRSMVPMQTAVSGTPNAVTIPNTNPLPNIQYNPNPQMTSAQLLAARTPDYNIATPAVQQKAVTDNTVIPSVGFTPSDLTSYFANPANNTPAAIAAAAVKHNMTADQIATAVNAGTGTTYTPADITSYVNTPGNSAALGGSFTWSPTGTLMSAPAAQPAAPAQPQYSSADIAAYLTARPGMTDAQIGQEAIAKHVSSAQLAAATGLTQAEVLRRAAAAGVPAFANGGLVRFRNNYNPTMRRA